MLDKVKLDCTKRAFLKYSIVLTQLDTSKEVKIALFMCITFNKCSNLFAKIIVTLVASNLYVSSRYTPCSI